jgi:hypothetical protein
MSVPFLVSFIVLFIIGLSLMFFSNRLG